ncbi:MAG: hypothetical protein K2Y39_19185 [Candidatus Obscuribacterales bacterium]|nr:hypothetical protein [Candidatus Obscuribacterales bacterium]
MLTRIRHGERQKIFLWATATLLFLSGGTNAYAEPPLWKQKSDKASGFESRKEFGKAAELYKEALRLLPAGEQNGKAKIEASLAANLFNLRKYDEALAYGEDAAQIARQLQQEKKLDPDVLINLNYLQENCSQHNRNNSVYSARSHELDNKAFRLSLTLKQMVNPNDSKLYYDWITYARTFLSLGRDAEAVQELKKLLKILSPKSERYENVQLCLAALESKHGRLTKLETDYMRRVKPEAKAIAKVAECKLWAADYKNAVALLDKAAQKISKSPDRNVLETVEINRVRASIKMDLADWKGAELYLRQNVELLTKYGKEESILRGARLLLAHSLDKQNRVAEADAIRNGNLKKKGSKRNYDFIFTDEERAALQKERSRTSK